MLLFNYFPAKLLAAIIILCFSLLAGAYPFIKKRQLASIKQGNLSFPSAEALAAGVFLGAGLIHMLGDAAYSMAGLHDQYPIVFLLAGVMFIFLLWLEHLTNSLHHHKGENSPVFALLATVMLSIHSFLAGAALGIGNSLSVILVILIAILAHKWAASFALSIKLNKSSIKTSLAAFLFILFSLMTPLGILFSAITLHHLNKTPMLKPVLTALSAGTFLYLGTLHGLARATLIKECCNLKQFTWFIVGFSIMAIVAIWT